MHLYTSLLRMTDTMSSQNIDFTPGTFCIHTRKYSFPIRYLRVQTSFLPKIEEQEKTAESGHDSASFILEHYFKLDHHHLLRHVLQFIIQNRPTIYTLCHRRSWNDSFIKPRIINLLNQCTEIQSCFGFGKGNTAMCLKVGHDRLFSRILKFIIHGHPETSRIFSSGIWRHEI
jgi:hypothetical protein